MSKQLSAEWEEKIEQEAEAYAERTGDRIYNIKEYFTHPERHAGYAEGATIYATRWEQAKKALEEIVNTHQLYRDINDENRESNHLRNIAYEALASWKEEGKGGNHE